MNFVAYTSVCEEDAGYAPQYLAEAERLAMPFAIHLDRCSTSTLRKFFRHPLCVGYTTQNNRSIEFNEQHKQAVFDLAAKQKPQWLMAWDVDETFERDAPRKLLEIADLDADYVDVRWVNLWDDPKRVRTDGPFSQGHRVKFYSMKLKWKFDHPITNGAKAIDRETGNVLVYNPHRPNSKEIKRAQHDLVCIHWGMMTRELRELHKDRWDRIYSAALRGDKNPYGFWEYALNETDYPPVTSEHDYF